MRIARLLSIVWLLTSFYLAIAQSGTPIFIKYGTGCGRADYTVALGLNDVGQVVGSLGTEGPIRGFVYQNGTFFLAQYKQPVPGGLDAGTVLNGINNAGQAIGYYSDGGANEQYALLREPSGELHVIDAPDNGQYWPKAINDHGDSVGLCVGGGGPPDYACMRSSKGKYTEIHAPSGMRLVPSGINNSKTITGDIYSLDNPSLSSGVVTKPNGHRAVFNCNLNGEPVNTYPLGINDLGQIVGSCGDSFQSFTFVRDPHGNIALSQEPAGYWGVNNFGDVIGNMHFESPEGPGPLCSEGVLLPNAVAVRK